LKRSLHIVDDSGEVAAKAPSIVSIGGQLVAVIDTGDGVAADRFVDALVGVGAARVDSVTNATPGLRIVIRDTPASPEGRRRAEALEAAADVVLGSARPPFARHLGLACARWVNS
jgi:hypothetical protein